MNTKEKLLKAFEQFRPHINGHKTATDLFFEAIEEVEQLQEQVKNCSIPDVVGQSEQLKPFHCPNCRQPWDTRLTNSCQCGASIKRF